ncbi:hypothetical protein ACHMW6_15445 [Pseudoduganella sp. UC29_106]|uniref:hypothetical protein n=1 Tax=Pseudoduganella sp. UC29_106 TaxID=3374553 RepID=UPI00375841D0
MNDDRQRSIYEEKHNDFGLPMPFVLPVLIFIFAWVILSAIAPLYALWHWLAS